MEKKYFFKIIGIIVAVIAAMAGIVILIDPFYHYHKPLKNISYVSGADVYVNDGKLKHFDYDTLTIGTSMAMNFRKEKVDAILGGNSLNVYYLGEGFKVINEGLETALETHPDLKLVVRTVDPTWFVSDVNWEGRESYPEYLYDKNPFNDVYYIYNKDVWKNNLIPSIVESFQNDFQGAVKQEGFGSRGLTGKENILKNYERPEKEIKEVTQEETEEFLSYLEENLDVNVLQVIEDYPDVEFYLFFPPYSICWWDQLNQNGTAVLERRIDLEKYAIEKMLQFDNIRLFSFFNNYELICNLNYYVDDVHYTGDVNNLILQWMKSGEYELTKENYEDYIVKEKAFYTSYDYDQLFGEQQ